LRAALVGVTAAIFGGQVWIDFVANGLPVQGLVLSDPDRIATPFFLTFFINFRGLDLRAAASPYLLAYDLLPPTFRRPSPRWRFSPAEAAMRPAGAWCSWYTGPPLCKLALGLGTCRDRH
jgi:hypothetical protein